MNKKVMMTVSMGISLVVVGLFYQNCSSNAGKGSVNQCEQQSILRSAYPNGFTVNVPTGISQGCVNSDDVANLLFNATTQAMTVTYGNNTTTVFNLTTGGGGCSKTLTTGGDNFTSSAGDTLATVLGTSSMQISNPGGLNCVVSSP